MKRFAEQFNKKASSVRLSAAERRDLKERLVSYMEYHPLPSHMRQDTPLVKESNEIVSEPFFAFSFDMTVVRSFAGAFAIILIIAVPMLAERSVPGDILYPVKIEFNEELRGTLAISPYAQVEWETTRLERRLSEARLLASEGKLTNEVEAGVAAAVKEHSDKAKENIAKLRETDEDEAAIAEIAFASALAVQSEVMEGQVEKETVETNEQGGRSVAVLADVVAKESMAAEATQADNKPSYEKLLARVEAETTRAYELFASVSDVASQEEMVDIERRLGDIERKVNQAIILHDGGLITNDEENVADLDEELGDHKASSTEVEVTDGVEATEEIVVAENNTEVNPEAAVEFLRTALTDTRKLISFMTDIDVRENVNIEELVPMTLTDDEKIALIKNALNQVALTEAEIEKRTVPESIYEKFVFGQAKLTDLVSVAKTEMAAGELDSARVKVDEALVIVADLFAMTSAALQLEEVVNESEVKASSTDETEMRASSTDEIEAEDSL